MRDLKTFGDRIKQLRKEKHLTQEDLSALISEHLKDKTFSRQSLSSWESGRATPKSDNLAALAAALGVSVDYLMGREEPHVRSDEDDDGTPPRGFSSDTIRVPVFDSPEDAVCAGDNGGFQSGAASYHMETYPRYIFGAPIDTVNPQFHPYIVRVSGDSMKDAGIYDNSLVCINPYPRDNVNGDIVLVSYRGDSYIKRIYIDNSGNGALYPANSNYAPKVFTSDDLDNGFVRILGRVTYSITSMRKDK